MKINPHLYSNSFINVRSDVIQFQGTNSPYFESVYKNSETIPKTMLPTIVPFNDYKLSRRQNYAILKRLRNFNRTAAIVPEVVALEMETV